jgi:hypothetical protein
MNKLSLRQQCGSRKRIDLSAFLTVLFQSAEKFCTASSTYKKTGTVAWHLERMLTAPR